MTVAEDWQPASDQGFVGTVGGLSERSGGEIDTVRLETTARHGNLNGIVHGGAILTLIDRAIGVTVRAQWDRNAAATATLTVHFLRPVQIGECLIARCSVRKQGRRLCFVDAEVTVEGRLVATATGTCL